MKRSVTRTDLTPCSQPAPAYFASGGRLVLNYNLNRFRPSVGPEDIELVIETRLPRGTPAGSYDLRVLPGSEMVLEDGSLIAPVIEDLSEGELSVVSDVIEGWDEGIPPIVVDEESQRVVGKIELRVESGAAFPVEVLTLGVEMRTEVPLNKLEYRVDWPPGKLECTGMPPEFDGDARSVFTNPEDGERYREERALCVDLPGRAGFHRAVYWLAGDHNYIEIPVDTSYPGRLLEYFKPLGEWVRVSEFEVRVPERAGGGDVIPLTFRRWEYEDQIRYGHPPVAQLLPFAVNWRSCESAVWGDEPHWTYDVRYHDGEVRVLGDKPPGDPPPVDAGIALALGEVSGRQGERVAVPVFASARDPLSLLRIAVVLDDAVATVEAVEVDTVSDRTGEIVQQVVARGEIEVLTDCLSLDPPEDCSGGIPYSIQFHEGEERFAVIDLGVPREHAATYPGEPLREVGRLLVRLRDDATRAETVLRLGDAVFIGSSGSPVETEPGGLARAPRGEVFAPASEVSHGHVAIDGLQHDFVRGDANVDGGVNIADAIGVLDHLFAGDELRCAAAVDVNADGSLDISDPVFLLNHLFQGDGEIVPPYPGCGRDASGLECLETACDG